MVVAFSYNAFSFSSFRFHHQLGSCACVIILHGFIYTPTLRTEPRRHFFSLINANSCVPLMSSS